MDKKTQKEISVLVPTYNRPRKLQRALEYYSRYNMRVFIADGSSVPCETGLIGDVAYFHLTSCGIAERIVKVLEEVDTPYVCLAADDDFVYPLFLKKATELLASDPSLATVFGKCYSFEEKTPAKWREVYGYAASIDQNDFKERFSSFFGAYYPLFYAPTRTEILKEVMKDVAFLPLAYANLAELLHGARIVASGKVVVLDNFYLARESAEVYLTGRLYPKVQKILKERPDLHEAANAMLARWMGSSEKDLFSKSIMEPYNKCCPCPSQRRVLSEAKLFVRRILGDDLTEKLKKRIPFLTNRLEFRSSSDFEAEKALQEIEQLVLNSLQSKECASLEGESCNASA